MKTLLTLLLVTLSSTAFSQGDFFKNREADLEVGVNSNFNLTTLELGLNEFKTFGGSCTTIATDAIIYSSEFGMKNSEFLYAPKITYSGNLLFLDGSISAINYNYSRNHSLYLRPQIGVTLLGYVDLVYGYNIPIIDKTNEFQGSMVTFRMKLIDVIKEL